MKDLQLKVGIIYDSNGWMNGSDEITNIEGKDLTKTSKETRHKFRYKCTIYAVS